MWYKYPCYVNDTYISRNLLVRYLCGKSDTNETSNTSNTAYSSDASKLFLTTSYTVSEKDYGATGGDTGDTGNMGDMNDTGEIGDGVQGWTGKLFFSRGGDG